MIVRPSEIRRVLREGADGFQVSENAVLALGAALEELAGLFARESAAALRRHNESRILQRLPTLSRLTDEHVREAIRRAHGKP